MPDSTKDKQNLDNLLRVGITALEVNKLDQLRKARLAEYAKADLVIQRRLEFLKWLVDTGRLLGDTP